MIRCGSCGSATCSGLQTAAPEPANKGHFRLTFRANTLRIRLTITANEPIFGFLAEWH
jgi:hypothetical protein